MNLTSPLDNSRGLALIFAVLVFAAVATAMIGLLVFRVHLREIGREEITRQRLEHIRKALENYYLVHQTLPDPATTTPPNSVPVQALLLPQQYRFDHNGQRLWYDAYPLRPDGSEEPVILVDNVQVAAVLVAPGPDRILEGPTTDEFQRPRYSSSAGDDILLPVSLTSQAIRIATHAVAVLQAAAKAYDANFYLKNNDIDTIYRPPETRWVDPTPPERIEDPVGSGNWYWEEHYGDESVEAVTPVPEPEAIIDEDGYSPALARNGTASCTVDGIQVCVCLGVLGNDPSRGTASLDDCSTGQPARDLALAMNLGEKYGLDPWGNPYQWGRAEDYGGLAASDTEAEDRDRDPHYWSFFSLGPDGLANTSDDIMTTNDRITGYFASKPGEALPVPAPVVRQVP